MGGAPRVEKPGQNMAEGFADMYGYEVEECKPSTKALKMFDQSGMNEKILGSLSSDNRPLFWLVNGNQERVKVVYAAGDGNIEHADLRDVRLEDGSSVRRWCRDDD
jgi:hypothetical protein